MPWTPSNPEQFRLDYLGKKTQAQLAQLHSGTIPQVDKYTRTCRSNGSLPNYKDIGIHKDIPSDPQAPLSTREFEERVGNSDGSINLTVNTKQPVRTLDDLIRVCKIDPVEHEITSFAVKKWDVAIKAQHTDEDGNITHSIETQEMYAVSAKLKPRQAMIDLREEVALILEEVREHCPKEWPVYNHPSDPAHKYLLELSITDSHFGKLAWWKESGESYDLKLAEDIFIAAVEDLLSKAAGYSFEEILFVVGNDLFNADNRNNTTFAGTPQSTDVRYQKTFTTVRRVIQDVIERLLRPRAKQVRVLMVSGNHDTETVFMFGEVLDAYFHHCENVLIENQPTQRKYAEFGDCMLMFTHGSEEKHADLPLIMAQEKREMWGRTRFREVHLGHFHKRKQMNWVGLDEHKGVSVRILPSLCAAEDWHTSKGYIGNIRSAEAYIWEATTGLCAMFYYTVPPFKHP